MHTFFCLPKSVVAKFVPVSRCAFFENCEGLLGSCSVNHFFSGGVVIANHNATRLPIFARRNRTDNNSRLLKKSEGNRDGDWNFCRGKEPDFALLLQAG